jgi:hypothetical protein
MRGAQVEIREKSTVSFSSNIKGRALQFSVYDEREQQQARVVRSNLGDQSDLTSLASFRIHEDLFASKREAW